MSWPRQFGDRFDDHSPGGTDVQQACLEAASAAAERSVSRLRMLHEFTTEESDALYRCYFFAESAPCYGQAAPHVNECHRPSGGAVRAIASALASCAK
jgi:hypothetical protein